MNKNNFCSVSKKKLLSMLSIAYFSLLTIFRKIGYMFFPSQVHIFFLGRIANVCSFTPSNLLGSIESDIFGFFGGEIIGKVGHGGGEMVFGGHGRVA
jgi:hypothetical protein